MIDIYIYTRVCVDDRLHIWIDRLIIVRELDSWVKDNRSRVSQGVLMVKNLPANAGEGRDMGSIPGSGRSPGGGHVTPLQYSCLENPMDRGAWRATVHGVAQKEIGDRYMTSR